MSSRRSEAPTPRQLRRARERGEIATSRDLTSAAALAGGTVALAVTAASLARELAEAIRSGIVHALGPAPRPWAAIVGAMALLSRMAFPALAGAATGALVAGSLQARGLFTLSAVRFRWERLHPFRGLSRSFSGQRLVTLLASTARAAILLVVGCRALRHVAGAATASVQLGAAAALRALAACALQATLPLAAVLLAFGVADLALAIRRHHRALRMTREEVRREQREEQGDPRRKAERRRVHRALAGAPPVRRAACLVVNPTHVAVALHHERGSDDAPVVAAKAQGRAAAGLRAEARRAGVPIVRDVRLARALFRLADVGEEIPVELYEAAAAVLAHLYAGDGGTQAHDLGAEARW